MTSNSRAIVLLAVLVIIAGALFFWMSQSATHPSPDVGQKIADTFLTALRDGQADAAWQSTTAEFKSAQGREAFAQFVMKNNSLTQPLEFVSSQLVDIQDQPRSEFVYRVTANKTTIRIVIGRESNDWKVDRLIVN